MRKKLKYITIFILSSLINIGIYAAEITYKDKIYDKNKNSKNYESTTCWAASTANILKSWHDYLKKEKLNIAKEIPDNIDEIYEKVCLLGAKKHTNSEGNSPANGIAWFIAGILNDTENQISLSNNVSGGGYWKSAYPNISSVSDIITTYPIESFQSIEELESIFANSIKKNSRISISLACDDKNIPSHAITFWGYDLINKKIKNIHITDSDDRYDGKKKFAIKLNKDKKIYLDKYDSKHKYYINNIVEFDMLLPPDKKYRYVSSENGDNNNSGDSWQKALKTLDAAIKSIKPIATSQEEYTIYMEEGIYEESSNLQRATYTTSIIDGENIPTNYTIDIQNSIENASFKVIGGYDKNDKTHLSQGKETLIFPTTQAPLALISIKNANISFESIIFDAKSQSKGLDIRLNSNIQLNNCTIKNAKSNTSGAGIYSEGNLTIRNSKILYNKSESSAGGIYSDGNLNLINTEVSYNLGGAIFSNGNLKIESSTLAENISENSGAAIYSMGNLSIKNSAIFKNESKATAGAIFSQGNTSLLNSTIAKNTSATACNGLLFAGEPSNIVKIDYCTLAENGTKDDIVIYINNPQVKILLNNSIIWQNKIYQTPNIKAKNSIISGYNTNKKDNVYNATEYFSSKYDKALKWNDYGFYTPQIKLVQSKNPTESNDQLGKARSNKSIGAIN